MRLLLLILGCFLSAACQNDVEVPKAALAPVHVVKAIRGNLTQSITTVGNVQSSASVAITPRVDGQIMDVFFTEGDEVAEGQPLLKIDTRPYTATLAEKEALLAKSRAQLTKAQHDLQRYAKLIHQGYISKEQYDQIATDAAALSATVAADKAAVDAARLNLSYCTINAPISGRIGELKMHKGAMVKDNDTGPIVTIDTIRPCRVLFAVPEAHLGVVQEKLRTAPLMITALPQRGKQEQGVVTLLDNNVDTKTGAIRLRGEFQNKDQALWPGQYVEVTIPIGFARDQIIVPTRAIQTGRGESYVYVIDENNKAAYRKVKILVENEDKTAIAGEVREGDAVVIDGQVRLAPGLPVRVLEAQKDPA